MYAIGLCTILIVLLSTAAYPKNYTVATNGDDANPGTIKQPWQSIAKANATLRPGDTVNIRTGTYDDIIRPVRSGVRDTRRIVYRANGDVIITGFSNADKGGMIALADKRYVTVDGRGTLKLRPPEDIAVGVNLCGARGVVIDGIDLHCPDFQRNCSRGVSFCTDFETRDQRKATRYNVLRSSKIVGSTVGSGPASDFTEDAVVLASAARFNLIEDNTIQTARHVGLYATGARACCNVIRGNTITNRQHTALSVWTAGHALNKGARFLVENNVLVASAGQANPHGGPGNAFQWGAHRLIIRNNLIQRGGSETQPNRSIGGLIGGSGIDRAIGARYAARDSAIYGNHLSGHAGPSVAIQAYDAGLPHIGNNVFVGNTLSGSILYWDAPPIVSGDVWRHNAISNATISVERVGPAALEEAVAWDTAVNPDFSVGNVRPTLDPPLTKVHSHDPRSGYVIRVGDSRFFFDASGFPKWMGVEPDRIEVGKTRASSVRAEIEAINGNRITLTRSIDREPGDSVWLTMHARDVSEHADDVATVEVTEPAEPVDLPQTTETVSVPCPVESQSRSTNDPDTSDRIVLNGDCPGVAPLLSVEEQDLLTQINAERATDGLAPLTVDGDLQVSATAMAHYLRIVGWARFELLLIENRPLALGGYHQHIAYDCGSDLDHALTERIWPEGCDKYNAGRRLDSVGYPGGGENAWIAALSIDAGHQAFVDSTTHYREMTDPDHTRAGVSAVWDTDRHRWIIVEHFAP